MKQQTTAASIILSNVRSLTPKLDVLRVNLKSCFEYRESYTMVFETLTVFETRNTYGHGGAHSCSGSVSVLFVYVCVHVVLYPVYILCGKQLQPAGSPEAWSLQREECLIRLSPLTQHFSGHREVPRLFMDYHPSGQAKKAQGEETEARLQGQRASKATEATPQTTASQHLPYQRQIPR